VIRLQAPDFRPTVMAFNLGAVLDGKENVALQPFDTVRVFGRYDFEDPPQITVNGEVRSPGKHLTNGETHLRDAIYLAGGLTPDAQTNDVQVFRREANGGVRVMDVSLAKALAGAPDQNILLLPQDKVIVQKSLWRADPALVQIQGEVLNPGRYPLAEGMTASELVRIAGGFKRSAFTEIADLSRDPVQNGESVVGEHREVQIARAMTSNESDVVLRDGDTLTIRQLSGWNDIGASITIKGEVHHAGTYGIREGDRLSSVLERAGGFRSTAYPRGAILDREQVREFAEKSRAELVRRIESEQPSLKIGPGVSAGEQAAFGQAFVAQREQILKRLQNEPVSGRQVIAISGDIDKWRNTPADIEVRAGDTLFIPKKPNFVLVSGQVFNPSAISYTPGKNAGWYLKQAGGVTDVGNKSQMFIVRADGSVVGDRSGLWSGGIESAGVQPGDVVVVPEKVIGGSSFWKNMLATAQIATNVAISASLLTGL
jgi:protein involved in polysaccharide export with SLBB domain